MKLQPMRIIKMMNNGELVKYLIDIHVEYLDNSTDIIDLELALHGVDILVDLDLRNSDSFTRCIIGEYNYLANSTTGRKSPEYEAVKFILEIFDIICKVGA